MVNLAKEPPTPTVPIAALLSADFSQATNIVTQTITRIKNIFHVIVLKVITAIVAHRIFFPTNNNTFFKSTHS
jgi:hypothetical protein